MLRGIVVSLGGQARLTAAAIAAAGDPAAALGDRRRPRAAARANLAGREMRNADRVHPERQRREIGSPTLFHRALLEPPHFVMQRKVLLGIEARAEAGAGA